MHRLKDKRHHLINTLRQVEGENEGSQSSQEFVNEVILDEWDKMKLETPLLSKYPKCEYSEAYNTFVGYLFSCSIFISFPI